MRWSAILFIMAAVAAGDQVLFYDDFDDGNADGWTEEGTTEFDVVGGMYWLHGGEACSGITWNGDASGVMSVPDYSIRVECVPEVCTDLAVVARFQSLDQSSYFLWFNVDWDVVYLMEYKTGQGSVIDQCGMEGIQGETYWLRLEVEGNDIRGKVWMGSAGDEPWDWIVSGTSTVATDPGSIGLFCIAWVKTVGLSCYFDEVEVTVPGAGALDPSTWAGIKAILH